MLRACCAPDVYMLAPIGVLDMCLLTEGGVLDVCSMCAGWALDLDLWLTRPGCGQESAAKDMEEARQRLEQDQKLVLAERETLMSDRC